MNLDEAIRVVAKKYRYPVSLIDLDGEQDDFTTKILTEAKALARNNGVAKVETRGGRAKRTVAVPAPAPQEEPPEPVQAVSPPPDPVETERSAGGPRYVSGPQEPAMPYRPKRAAGLYLACPCGGKMHPWVSMRTFRKTTGVERTFRARAVHFECTDCDRYFVDVHTVADHRRGTFVAADEPEAQAA